MLTLELILVGGLLKVGSYDIAATASAVSVETETTGLYGSLIGVLGPPEHRGTVV